MTAPGTARDGESGMYQSLIVGLLLAGVSATSLVAFRHPNGYARLFPFLIVGATALFSGVVIWQLAVEAMWADMNAFLKPDYRQQAVTVKDELSPPFLWIAVSYVAVLVFFWINLKLPPFLTRTDDSGSGPANAA